MPLYRTLKTEHRKRRECGDLSPVHDWNTTTINGAVQTRTHGPAHELLTMSGAQVTNSPRTLTYDTKGNMTTDDRGCGMTWDFDNMLQSFAANGVTDLKNATYEYDAFSRRISTLDDTLSITCFEGRREIYTTGPSSQKRVHGSYVDDLLVTESALETIYYISNFRYTTYATVRQSTEPRLSEVNPPFGQPRGTSIAPDTEQQFLGRRLAASPAVNFRWRELHLHSGRFQQRDKLTYVDGRNMYCAFQNSPLRNLDPTGLTCSDPCALCKVFLDKQKDRDKINGWTWKHGKLVREQRHKRPGEHVTWKTCSVEVNCVERPGFVASARGEKGNGASGRRLGDGNNDGVLSITISLGCEAFAGLEPLRQKGIFEHELVHASDYCFGKDSSKDCDSCKELEKKAHRHSCGLWYGSGDKFERCVMCGVEGSCKRYGNCTDRPANDPPCKNSDTIGTEWPEDPSKELGDDWN